MKDNVGILLPVASLPGNHGIGDFGPSAYRFIRWLKNSNYKYWQVLPLNPVGPGNSPYMSTCSEALETRYICLDLLVKDGLLKKVPLHHSKAAKIDYQDVLWFKEKYLYKAYKAFLKTKKRGYAKFKKDNEEWLKPFALFIAFRKRMNYVQWNTWPKEMQTYWDHHDDVPEDLKDECEFQIFMQFIAYKQWNKLWAYARKNGIKIIADCPFYVGIDSTDCWLHKEQFLMDSDYHPTLVSGCPPDAFSDDGQLWGTPIFDFKKMKEDNYSFLVHRIGYLATTCDLLRLDHFRAWDTYCVIPAEDVNARRGVWWVGPRYEFFDALYTKYPNINLIAEDLGDLFPGVHELRDHYNLPGMYICEFTIFDVNAMSTNRQIVYPGTHDNQTLMGWLKDLPQQNIDFLNWKFNHPKDLYKAVFEYIWNLPSLMTIFQLQDLIKLDDRGRINWPGTVNDINWSFKFKDFSWIKKVQFFNK
ncbi:MAG: 4-alpha-glucanotransferase [Candidatus Onthovivens sp.]|nr:4-alpha-glucanotransferase [Candidatus Onthovivens sp.]